MCRVAPALTTGEELLEGIVPVGVLSLPVLVSIAVVPVALPTKVVEASGAPAFVEVVHIAAGVNISAPTVMKGEYVSTVVLMDVVSTPLVVHVPFQYEKLPEREQYAVEARIVQDAEEVKI